MPTRQYIGARYVPKFYKNSVDGSANWESNVVYEPLTYVTLTNGHMYISKKQVPDTVGTPASNKNYWLDVGSYNGFIENLQNQINALDTEVDNLELNKADKSSIERNLLVIGNSYVDLGVASRLASCFDHAYYFTGSGTGFVAYTEHNQTFESQLDSAISDTSFDNSTITDILFVSAMGDTRAYTENGGNFNTQFPLTLASIKTKIDTNFVNCDRVSVTFAEIRSVPYFTGNKYSALFAIHRRFKDILPQYNFAYLGWSGFNLLCYSGYTQNDNYHPNSDGVFYIGGVIKTSYFGPIHYNKRTVDSPCSFNLFSDKTITLVVELTPDEVCINIRDSSITSGSAASISAQSDLIDLSQLALPIPPRTTYPILMHGELINTANGTKLCDITVNLGAEDSNGLSRMVITHSVSLASVDATSVSLRGFNLLTYTI